MLGTRSKSYGERGKELGLAAEAMEVEFSDQSYAEA